MKFTSTSSCMPRWNHELRVQAVAQAATLNVANDDETDLGRLRWEALGAAVCWYLRPSGASRRPAHALRLPEGAVDVLGRTAAFWAGTAIGHALRVVTDKEMLEENGIAPRRLHARGGSHRPQMVPHSGRSTADVVGVDQQRQNGPSIHLLWSRNAGHPEESWGKIHKRDGLFEGDVL